MPLKLTHNPGLFHSKERFEQVKSLPSFALSLCHIVKAAFTIQIEGQIACESKVVG